MQDQLQAFLDNVIDSLIKLEIVLFFHGNPGTIDTPQGVAMRIYRNSDVTTKALEELCAKGVLDCAHLGAGKYQLYSLSQDASVLKNISLLDECYHGNRKVMLEIVKRFLPGKGNPGESQNGAARGAL